MKRLLLRRGTRRDHHPPSQHSLSFQRCFLSGKVTKSSSLDDADDPASSAGIRNSLLRAPFQRVAQTPRPPLFPWRHSEEILPRLIPGSQELEEKGYLLGGNVVSSNPKFDSYATAYMFLDVPWYKMLFFSHWQADLAENMSWAFSQATAATLSNVYQVPFDKISKGDYHLDFDHTIGTVDNDDKDGVLHEVGMVEDRLRSLFESAREHGKDQIQVRLQCQPTGAAHMVNLFVFPLLSRNYLKSDPELKSKYHRLLELMAVAPRDALPIYHELVAEFQRRGVTESTVVCQVLVACDEIFWVKDLATGAIIQGHEDGLIRKVWHLVRMEMVVETHPAKRPILPFQHKQGNWQLTDIDDLLEGNLII